MNYQFITSTNEENRRGKENEYFEIANRRIENAQLKIYTADELITRDVIVL